MVSVDSVCMSVCLSVCLSDDNFQKTSCRKFIFAHPVYLQAVQVRFIYEGYQVKVKITGLEKARNRYTRSGCLPVNLTC